ncbi:S8 family serine peptidase [Pleurocapsa sp. FMAR1]|uniref:S8 family serine peptidase n=1 Tax=Pleurocapsa sp. FMAR1 TaxID=3040204 RepID=UPI0029C9ACC0|nr:S8 family serine peptidase [Pleurocapsa sp. FMAR1]
MSNENIDNTNFSNTDSVILGTSEAETKIATSNDDPVLGFAGDDILIGKDGNDSLFGGAGNDSLASGRGNNLLLGNEGSDHLVVSVSRQEQAGNNTLNGGEGDDWLSSGDGNDLLAGEAGKDIVLGYGGNDNIEGGNGNDGLNGGKGNDYLNGGEGNDQVEGGDDNDLLFGGTGSDLLRGLEGNDNLTGDEGNDYFALVPNTGQDTVLDFEDGKDRFVLTPTPRFGEQFSFEQLSITQGDEGTIISLADTNEILATVKNVSADKINKDDFINSSEIENQFNILNEDTTTGLPSSASEEQNESVAEEQSIPEADTDSESVVSVTSQGVEVMNVEEARNKFGVDGSGVTVGLSSNSYDRFFDTEITADDDVISGDLPGEQNPDGYNDTVHILDDSADNSLALSAPSLALNDEGRAMIQLVHDVAPGANIIFRTGFNGADDFAQGIDELVAADADIIIDDVIYTEEPFFQNGVVAQAAERAVESGVAYFASAGNYGDSSYEAEFRPVQSSEQSIKGLENYTFHDFNPDAEIDVFQDFTLDPGASTSLSFQWDEPFASAGGKGANGDLDVFVLDAENNIVAFGAESNIGSDAVEIIDFTNSTEQPGEYKLAIGQNTIAGGSPPNRIKYVDFAFGTAEAEYATQGSTIFSHRNVSGVETVGASLYQTPEELEFFSSVGTTPILFDSEGNRLTEPEFRQKPDLVAPDGINTTFFGQDIEEDGSPNFFGTSAASPHAAGVAALLLEANPEATPEEIYQALEQTAVDIEYPTASNQSGVGYDEGSGYGLIQADLALETFANNNEII